MSSRGPTTPVNPRPGAGRGGATPKPDRTETPVGPRKYPGWTDPPLPSGPVAPTPGGDRSLGGGSNAVTASALVGPTHRVPILFGRCRLSPDLAMASQDSYSGMRFGKYLAIISEGPIDAIESWEGATTSDFRAIETTLGTLTTPTGHLGGTIGLAAAYIETKNSKPWSPAGIFRGRLLFDPRLGAWGAGEYPDPLKCAYSTNPALAAADLRTFPQYGDLSPTVISWASVIAAADYFDELVDGAKRYTFNLWMTAASGAEQWLDTLKLHFGLSWREDGGVYYLDFSAPVADVAAIINDDDIVDGTQPRMTFGGGAGLVDRPNRFRAEWVDPASDWAIRTVEVRHPEVEAGAPIRDAAVYKLHGLQTEAMAIRALWRIAKDIWSEQELECEVTATNLHLQVGSRVTCNLTSLGLSGVDFLVTRFAYNGDRVNLALRRYDTTTWTPPGSTGGALPDYGYFDTPPDLVVPTRATPESEITAVTPTSKVTTVYLGFSWQLPTFQWVKDVLIRVWPAGTAATWDTPGYTEYPSSPSGDSRFAADPTWKVSLKPKVFETQTATFDALGNQTNIDYAGDGYVAILRLRSLALNLSAGVTLSEAAHSSSVPTPPATVVVETPATPAPASGEIAVWDTVAGKLTHTAALMWDETNKRLTLGTASPAASAMVHLYDTAFSKGFLIGDDVTLATGAQKGVRIIPFNTGDIYFDLKTHAAGKVYFRTGQGTESGAARTWMAVEAATGNVGVGTPSPAGRLTSYYATNVAPSLAPNAFAPFIINNAGEELAFGVDSAAPYPVWMQARYATAARDIAINPLGGNVSVGTTSVPAGYRMIVDGTGVGGFLSRANDPVTAVIAVQNTLSTGARVYRLTAGIVGVTQEHFSIYDATAAATRLVIDTSGHTLPGTTWTYDLGANATRWRSLYAAELRVETLVAQNTIATIGGNVLVAPTTKLTAALAAAATTLYVEHNSIAAGNILYLKAAPGGAQQVEFMSVTSGPTGTGPYAYVVVRNLDGTGANDWPAGSAIVDTGTTGNGFIDLYSVRGTKAATEYGPTIVGNVRNSATFNDWSPRWAIGNLNGLYGYATNEYGFAAGVPTAAWVKVDPTNGVRIGHNATTKVSIDAAGNASFTGAVTAASGAIGGWTIGATELAAGSGACIRAGQTAYDTGTGFWLGDVAGAKKFSLGDAAGNKLTWDGSALALTGAITAASGQIGGWTIGAADLYSGGIYLHSSATPASNKIYVGAAIYGGTTTAFYVDGSGRLSLKDKFLWDGTSLTVLAGNVTLDSNGIWIPPGGAGRTSSFGFVNGSTWIGGTYASAGARNVVGLTAQKSGYGATVECSTDGTIGGGKVAIMGLLESGDIAVTGHVASTQYVTATTYMTAGTNITAGGLVSAGSAFYCNGNQVVGSRGAAVADATDAATAITQLNALLARCRAHGLIS